MDEETGEVRKVHMVSFINRVFGDCANLLDTGPLRETMKRALHLKDEEEWVGEDSEILLMINATNVRNGRHEIVQQPSHGFPRSAGKCFLLIEG